MPVTAEQRHARAQVAARTRHHGESADVADPLAELERARVDAHIDALVKSAGSMTSEQAARIGGLFQYLDPAAGG